MGDAFEEGGGEETSCDQRVNKHLQLTMSINAF